MKNRLLIILIAIAFVGCQSQSILHSDCFKWSYHENDLVTVSKKEVKKHIPLINKLDNRKIDGKVISCSFDKTHQVYILELKNNVESYCIKASSNWEVDSIVTILKPYY